MSIPQKIATVTANFFVVQASWIPWLLVGFSMGGLAVVLQRALSLILGSTRGRRQEIALQRQSHAFAGDAAACSELWNSVQE